MGSDDAEARASRLAEEVRPVLGAEGFGDERIDELAHAFVHERIGTGAEEFVMWARAEGPIGIDPQEGY